MLTEEEVYTKIKVGIENFPMLTFFITHFLNFNLR